MPSSRRRRRPNSREAVKALKVRDVRDGLPRALPKGFCRQVCWVRGAIEEMVGGSCCSLAVRASVVVRSSDAILEIPELGAETRAELCQHGSTLAGEVRLLSVDFGCRRI